MPLNKPSIVAQICSLQKDDFCMNSFRGMLNEATQRAFGIPQTLKWSKHISALADVLYFSLTTVSGLQTLGEEYTGIIQVDPTGKRTPSLRSRIIMIITHTIIPLLIDRILTKLENLLSNQQITWLTLPVQDKLLLALPKLKLTFATIHRLHLSLFYIWGLYQSFSKRFSGIHYTKFFPNQAPPIDSRFTALGWLTLAQNLTMLCVQGYSLYRDFSPRDGSNEQALATAKSGMTYKEYEPFLSEQKMSCTLCLQRRKFSSCTPCGHLFCYYCIHNWVASKPECPLCRQAVDPREIVYLHNY